MKLRKFSGTIITNDLDNENDIFPMESIQNIDIVGMPVTIQFENDNVIGKVVRQQILGNGLEIEVNLTESTDHIHLTCFENKGLGIMAEIDSCEIDEETDVRTVILGEILGVSIVAIPSHPDWKINRVWEQDASELKEGIGFSDE